MSADKHLLTAHDLRNLRTFHKEVNNNSSNNSNAPNMVLSTIPLDGHAVVFQPSHLISTTAGQQQRSSAAATVSNGFHSAMQARPATNSISNLIAAAALQPTTPTTITNTSANSFPSSSKYVFLQQNGNGQYTTYEGTSSTTANNVGNIVLVATESMELGAGGGCGSDSHINDEELRPLSWLSDQNLIKGIVTTTSGGGAGAAAAGKGKLNNNICIVNANGTHEFIEELPPHVACEEHVTTIATSGGLSSSTPTTTAMSLHELAEAPIRTLSVGDFQQQFLSTSNKRCSNSSGSQQLAALGNFVLAQESVKEPQQQQHIFNNIATLGATTTVHVGPSGTTTVVEYKSNPNFAPTQRQLMTSNNNAIGTSSNIAPTTTASNNSNNTHSNSNYVPSSVSTGSSATALHASPAAQAAPLKPAHSPSISQPEQGKQSTCTSHHPHKKYLREKMNGLDQGGGGAAGCNSTASSVVSSPASSSSSNSTLSSSLSTAAVNGANSPVSKSNSSTYYTLLGAGSSAAGSAFAPANTTTANVNQQQQQNITSPVMGSPNAKDYSTTPQQQQQAHQSNLLTSPTSYSSYENDSLKDFDISTSNSGRLASSTPHQQQQQRHSNHHNNSQQQNMHSPSPTHHYQKQSAMSPTSSTSSSTTAGASGTPHKQKHPNNVPYDPLVHTHNKPPYSFSSLIFMAIEGSTEKALPVKEIYSWIVQHFPYFKTAPTGWKNSVRHNLSLNKSFVKVEKAPNMGKGSLWRVEQQQRQNLIQALTRSPFFPNAAVDKINMKNASTTAGYDQVDGDSPTNRGNNKSPCIDARFDARLFPKLSKVFKDLEEHNALNENGGFAAVGDISNDDAPSDYSTIKRSKYSYNSNNSSNHTNKRLQQQLNAGGSGSGSGSSAFHCYNIERLARDCGADSIDDVNAATAMLALKHGPKVFTETFQNGVPVITSSPSEDHTYSAGVGSGGSGAAGNPSNGSAIVHSNGSFLNGVSQQHGKHAACGDNQSNGASSDAAYESSEENHKISPQQLADQQRHRDGVDALLSLSLCSFMESSSSNKRPSANTVEEEHRASASFNTTPTNGVGKVSLTNPSTKQSEAGLQLLHRPRHPHHYQHQHSIFDEGYNTQSYYGSSSNNNSNNSTHYTASPSTPKKPKPLRNLRAKIKRKSTWIR